MKAEAILPTERSVQRAIPELSDDELARFERQVRPNENGCWEWSGKSTAGKYRLFKISGAKYLAHRIAWTLKRGGIPAGFCVCHTCDNPICVNPEHLFLGTHADNMADKKRKGRDRRAERSAYISSASLSDSDVLSIRYDRRPQKEIAASYGVNQSTISDIKRGVTWSHL